MLDLKFEIPNRKGDVATIGVKPQYSPNLSTYKNQRFLEAKNTMFLSLREGEPFTAVCRVIPLISQEGHVKGFILKSVIGEVGKKKEEKQEQPKETLDSFVGEDEQI